MKKTIALLLCLFCCVCFTACNNSWQEGEKGSIVYTENDQDPNMLGEIVTEEKAKELEFNKKIYIYVPNEDGTDVVEKISYTKKEWLNAEYIVKVQSAFLDNELLKAEIEMDEIVKINFCNANAVQRYCYYSKPEINENGTNENHELTVLRCYFESITGNFAGINNVFFFIEGSPYNTNNIETYNGNVFA